MLHVISKKLKIQPLSIQLLRTRARVQLTSPLILLENRARQKRKISLYFKLSSLQLLFHSEAQQILKESAQARRLQTCSKTSFLRLRSIKKILISHWLDLFSKIQAQAITERTIWILWKQREFQFFSFRRIEKLFTVPTKHCWKIKRRNHQVTTTNFNENFRKTQGQGNFNTIETISQKPFNMPNKALLLEI